MDSRNKESYKNLIKEVHKSDGKITVPEKVFLYRCNMMFNDVPDQEIFMFKNSDESIENGIINLIDTNNISTKYSIEKILFDVMYVTHPAHINQKTQELIPLEALYSDSFLTS